MQQAGSRLGLRKELLFTPKLCLSQVTSPRALLNCHLPRGRGCDIKQTQICQGHRLEHLLQPDTAAGRPADRRSTWQCVCVRVWKWDSHRCTQTQPRAADSWLPAAQRVAQARSRANRAASKTFSSVTLRSAVWPQIWPHLVSCTWDPGM